MAERGFLPLDDPLVSLPITDYKQTELIFTWENLAQIIPHYLKEGCLREELIFALRKANGSYYYGFIDNFLQQRAYERVFLLNAYFASAYINCPESAKKLKLPKEISVPFSRAAHLVSRSPILDYTSYVLYNWKKTIASSPMITGNVEPLITFTDSFDEKLLISTLIEMEFSGKCFQIPNPFAICDRLKHINNSLSRCNRAFIKQFLTDVFFQDFDNLIYEGWLQEKQTFRCCIFEQSPFLAHLRKYLDNLEEEGYGRETTIGSFKKVQKECRNEAEALFGYLSFKD